MNSPKEVAQNYIMTGAAKTKLSIGRMFWLGIMAGIFIALAAASSTVASSSVQVASVAKLVSGVVFTGGLAMVLIAGSELFTGNCLIIIPVMEKQATWGGMLKNWLIVYIGNFAGSIFIAALVVYGHTFGLFSNLVGATAIHTAVSKVTLDFGDAFIRGILCNLLVCIAVWMALAAKDIAGKIAGLFFPVMFFVLCGYEHSVANMYFITAGLFAGGVDAYAKAAADAFPKDSLAALTWSAFFVKNLLPVTLGNIVGGSVLVGLGYWFTYIRDSAKKSPVNTLKK